MTGSFLVGDNTIPGIQLPDDLKALLPEVFQTCREYGLDFYDTVVQMLTYDEMSEVCAYGGFPVRYPHWKWGMEYEELQRGYQYGQHRIYEVVSNTSPCYIYCLDSNTLLDNIMVVAHALGHNDFFKNNIHFSQTNRDAMNMLANHGSRIRRYMVGRIEEMSQFLNYVDRIETLIDPSKAWERKEIKDRVFKDKREYKHPDRLFIGEGKEHMDDYINPPEWIKKQRDEIELKEKESSLGISRKSTKDIMKFIRDNAPLKLWQQDVLAMRYEESMYFAPQRTTKVMNEGWASMTDHKIMVCLSLADLGQKGSGIIDYAKHKVGVLGGKYSSNPYKLGYELFLNIEERWNKGRHGHAYDDCKSLVERESWDTKENKGKEKVFEVRKYYNDYSFIDEFFTEEFCRKMEFYEWKKYPNGEYKIDNRDYKNIKKRLLQKHQNGGTPDIRLVDHNHRGKGYLFLQHEWDGRTLYPSYVGPVLEALNFFWKNNVYLVTKTDDNEDIVYYYENGGKQGVMKGKDYLGESKEKEESEEID